MTTSPLSSTPKRFGMRGLRICGQRISGLLAACVLAATTLGAQTPAPRLQAEISSSSVSTLKGSLHPMAQAQYDSGRLPADTRLNGMSIVFNRSAAQQADLEALIAAQQNPSSPLYHQWLNPDQFAARFGMAQSDLDKVETWLQQQGFSIDSVARSRNMIRFSGSVNQVEQAFQTQMHFYTIAGEKHFAPSTALTLPSAFMPVVTAVRNLNDFRPRPMIEKSRKGQANPAFTSSVSGSVFFAPGDIKLAYGVNTLISAGSTGTGQTIAVVGQSALGANNSTSPTDIENFENAAGLTVKDPNQVLVPGSGTPETFAGDQGESDLDVEWSGGIAPGAEIFFVYTGSSTNFGVFDSIEYAIDEKIGNIISVSYGSCEPAMSAGSASALDAVFQQATTQGQTVVAASGDSGSSACYEGVPTTQNGFPALATQEQLAVSYPASSQYVTGVGGTEIVQANDTAGSAYWEPKGSSGDEVTSLLKYIPEVAWNDDASAVAAGSTTLSSTGGGASTLYTTKPSWQTGVPGIPADSKRDVPDVAFYASPDLPGYLYCTSDQSDWNTTQAPVQQASCNSGFRDSATQDLNVAGGTSFATPIFAGMVAVLNQAQGYSAGQGLLNPTLYKMAVSNAAAFNDVTTGNNECPSSLGANFCSAASEGSYTTTTGYDQVTGLGSVNLSTLVTAWPANTSTLIGTTTSVAAASATPAVNTNDTITITVASDSGTTIPSGTVNLSIDQTLSSTTGALTGGTATSVTLSANGVATYTANFAASGVHTIVAQYAGDSTHAASTGSISINIATVSSGKGTFAFTPPPTNVTVAQGSSANSTITVTPAGGYTGTVELSLSTTSTSLNNLCYGFATPTASGGSVMVTGTSAVTTQLTFDAHASDCASAAIANSSKHAMHRLGPGTTSQNNAPNPAPLGMAFAGLLLAGFLGRSSRKLRSLAAIIGLLALGLGLSACGSGSASTTVSNPPKGTYTITVSGQDSTTATITATPVTFTLTID